jgi:hypothetical protein
MKRLILGFIVGTITLVIAGLAPVTPAYALLCGVSMNGTCFAIATGNFNAGAVWSNTDGGATCSATCTTGPTAGDTVVFDSLSGAITVTITAAASIANLDASGGSGGSGSPFTGTLAHNNAQTLTVTGTTFKFSAGMTYNPASATAAILFTGTGTLTFTSAGKSLGNFTVNGSGGSVVPADAFTVGTSATLTLTVGTFDASVNNVAVSTGAFSSSSNTNVRTLTCSNSATWTLTASLNLATIWDFTQTTNLTYTNPCTVNINITETAAAAFQSGGKTFNVTYTSNNGTSRVDIFGSPTFTTFAYVNNAPGWLTINAGTTLIITNAFTATATAAKPLYFASDSAAGAIVTLQVPSGCTFNWAIVQNVTAKNNQITANNSLSLGGNAGATGGSWQFNAPGGASIIGGYLLQRDLDPASNDNRPAWSAGDAA